MFPTRIVPEYSLLLRYDIRPGVHVPYFRFVRQELEPAMRESGIYLQDAWHVAYGSYPERQMDFVTDNLEKLITMLHSPRWQRLEEKLRSYVDNYDRRVTRYMGIFKV